MDETAGVSSTAGLVSTKLWQAVATAHTILPDCEPGLSGLRVLTLEQRGGGTPWCWSPRA